MAARLREYRVCKAPKVFGSPCGHRLEGTAQACEAHRDLHIDLLAKLRRDVLSPDVLEAELDRAVQLERSPEQPDRRVALADELARLEREIARYTEAIAQGGSLPSMLDAVQAPRAPAGGPAGPAQALGRPRPDRPHD